MVKYLALLFFLGAAFSSFAQKRCNVEDYLRGEIAADPQLRSRLDGIDAFANEKATRPDGVMRVNQLPAIIKIPIVFHVVYHTPDQNLSDPVIEDLVAALNRDFNKKNADTVNIPAAFKPYASSMGFEFKLATTNPQGIGTKGIVRKYTPIQYWMSDDKVKFSASYGDDAWDAGSYLNIWICNMKDVRGYSTFPGMGESKDGIVLSVEDIRYHRGTSHALNDYRTIVHEVGHWLNLYHIWGEGYCGDDKVDDTPKQSTYTPGCPTGQRLSCGNNSSGDMYMNFMDFTDDACMNMFTYGQRKRARSLFETGGARNSILHSKGLDFSIVPEESASFYPKWVHPQVYPNPAKSTMNVYFDYDERWLGKEIQVLDMSGRVVMSKIINSKIQTIDISRLNPGVYFVRAQKEDEKMSAKFVKL